MKLQVTLLLFLTINFSFSQSLPEFENKNAEKRYNRISNSSKHLPSALTTNISNLAYHLTTDCKSDLEKIRAIFVWVSNNIQYDMHSFLNNQWPPQDPEYVLRSRTAVCQGYSNLVNALCIETGLECVSISGYSKGFDYQKGQNFEVTNHVWNGVKINDQWHLIDATWAASKTNLPHRYKGSQDPDRYFLTAPTLFVSNHLPEDPMWQLLDNPVTLAVFQKDEAVINDYLLSDTTTFNYQDSLKAWEQLSNDERRLVTYQRSSRFNPGNMRARFHLGLNIFYQALDSMNMVHQLGLNDINEGISNLEDNIYTLLDESAFHFAEAARSNNKEAKEFLEEVTYQKGVWKYEAGQRIFDIIRGFDKDELTLHYKSLSSIINQYYDEAIQYFELIDPDSRYYEDAIEYIDLYIKEYRPR